MRPPVDPTRLWPLVAAADRFLCWSVRWRVDDPGDRLRPGQRRPQVFACRHGQLWPLLWAVGPLSPAIVVSRSPDGEMLARVLRRRGLALIRGSSSSRGSEAARGILRALRRGCPVGLAVDGPRGPRGRVGDGLLRLAQRAQAPIVPLWWEGGRRWVVPGSWDAFEVPLPGSAPVLHVGEPLWVGPGEDALQQAGRALAAVLGGHRAPPEPSTAVPAEGTPKGGQARAHP